MNIPEYKFRGARALVILHDIEMRKCFEVWKEVRRKNVQLGATDDKDYTSIFTLIRHVFRASRGYMIWMCQMLELPDPQISKTLI